MYNVLSSWLGVKFMEKYSQILAMIFDRKLIWFISGIYAWALNLKKGK